MIGSVKQGNLVWVQAEKSPNYYFGHVIENNIHSLTVLIHIPEVKVEFDKFSGWSIANPESGFSLRLRIHKQGKLLRPGINQAQFNQRAANLKDRRLLITTLVQATQSDWGSLENQTLFDILKLINRHFYLPLINYASYEGTTQAEPTPESTQVSIPSTTGNETSLPGSGSPDQVEVTSDDWFA